MQRLNPKFVYKDLKGNTQMLALVMIFAGLFGAFTLKRTDGAQQMAVISCLIGIVIQIYLAGCFMLLHTKMYKINKEHIVKFNKRQGKWGSEYYIYLNETGELQVSLFEYEEFYNEVVSTKSNDTWCWVLKNAKTQTVLRLYSCTKYEH